MTIIGRPINGISINGLEYVLDDDGNEMQFEDENAAKAYMLDNGFKEDDFEWMVFEEVE